MRTTGLLDFLPIWTLLPITLVVGLLSVELGCRIAAYRRKHAKDKTEAPVAPVVGSTLGLLAFLLAFTFGMAALRFEERRQSVLAEANAISTAYLRASVLSEPVATDSHNLLREYVKVRLAGSQAGNTAQLVSKSEDIHKRLWAGALAAAKKDPPPLASLFMQSSNEVINLHARRLNAAFYSRVPGEIWVGLYLLLVLAMSVTGYHEGISGTRRSLAVFVLVLAFSAAFVLITDLDRPGQGFLEVNQQAMIDLKNSMAAPSTTP